MSAVAFEEHSKAINSRWLTYLHSIQQAASGNNSCFPRLLAAGNAHCSLKVLLDTGKKKGKSDFKLEQEAAAAHAVTGNNSTGSGALMKFFKYGSSHFQ